LNGTASPAKRNKPITFLLVNRDIISTLRLVAQSRIQKSAIKLPTAQLTYPGAEARTGELREERGSQVLQPTPAASPRVVGINNRHPQ